MKHLALILLFSAGFGCATPTLDPSEVHVIEEAFGLYQRRDEIEELRYRTSEVPCQLGTIFGAQIKVNYSATRRIKVPLQGRWRVKTQNENWRVLEEFLSNPLIFRPRKNFSRASVPSVLLIIRLQDKAKLVPSDYRLEFFNPADESLYFQREFRVRGCEEVTGRGHG